ncbi:hypothetical protein PAMP_023058 [Pampus punctatissimus]
MDGVVINFGSLRVWTPLGIYFKRPQRFCLLASDLAWRTGRTTGGKATIDGQFHCKATRVGPSRTPDGVPYGAVRGACHCQTINSAMAQDRSSSGLATLAEISGQIKFPVPPQPYILLWFSGKFSIKHIILLELTVPNNLDEAFESKLVKYEDLIS